MNVNQIDWNEVWREGVLFFIGGADKAALWDRNALRWDNAGKRDDFAEKVMERLILNPDWDVLDVGCGAGVLALPIAKSVRRVTGLDASNRMLQILEQNAKQQGITNITYLHKKIEDVVIGKDIEKHDVVIASRSMGLELNVRKFLQAMDDATKRYAYIVWVAYERAFDIGMYQAINRPYGETRTHVVLYNLLYQMGIRANIELFECQQTALVYNSIEEATEELRTRFASQNMNRDLNEAEVRNLGIYLRKVLKKYSDGTFQYSLNEPSSHALIWWEKKTG